jgi:PAS domain-containing protein
MQEAMTAPRLTDSGARPSWLFGDAAPSAQRSALMLYALVGPCAIALAFAVGNAVERPLVLALAAALAAGQVIYLRYGAPGTRGWALLAVSVPLTLAVTTLSMGQNSEVLLPLLFASVCWSALSLPGAHVVASVAATTGTSAVGVLAREFGWSAGSVAEGLGPLLVSAAGFALVGGTVYRLATVMRGAHARAEQARADSEGARQVSDAVVAALQDALVILAPDGRITRVNEKMCEITGYAEHELIGTAAPFPFWPP